MKSSSLKWGIATCVFIGALIVAVSGTRSKQNPSPPAQPQAPEARTSQPSDPPSCPRPRHGVWTGGKPNGREVALSFDDGPSAQTASILRALRRHDAHGTFFIIGSQIGGQESLLREAVRQGNELGNHSTTHAALPTFDDIATTSRTIKRVTGSPPCLFRPPDGVTDDRLLRDVHRLDMTTVAWDVDTADWADQSPADIRARALATVHRGSIILLHDGGGDRAGTVRAVSAIIDELHKRGYEVVTVSDLFHGPRT